MPSRAGRPPTPTHLKIARGNPGRHPLPPLEPKPLQVDSIPPPPDHLDDLAAHLWSDVHGPRVVEMRVMTEADWTALAILCSDDSRRIQLEDDINENGMFVDYTTTAGETMQKVRPQVTLLNKVNVQVVIMLREFGLTPSSRTKVQVVPGSDSDEDKGKRKYFG